MRMPATGNEVGHSDRVRGYRRLREEPHAFGEFLGLECADVGGVEEHASAGSGEQASKGAEERRLAAGVRPDNDGERAGWDGHLEPVEDRSLLVGDRQVGGAELTAHARPRLEASVVERDLSVRNALWCRMSWTNFISHLANAGKACLHAKYSTIPCRTASEQTRIPRTCLRSACRRTLGGQGVRPVLAGGHVQDAPEGVDEGAGLCIAEGSRYESNTCSVRELLER